MKTIIINQSDIQRPGFIVPPENGGQIVTVSYACTTDFILARSYDASDHSEKIYAYNWPDDAQEGSFQPQNSTPELGEFFGDVRIRNT